MIDAGLFMGYRIDIKVKIIKSMVWVLEAIF